MAATIALGFALLIFRTSHASSLMDDSKDLQEVCYADECRQQAGQTLLQVKRSYTISKVEQLRMNVSGPGATATLDENGYNSVKALCCSTEMMAFIRRLIESLGMVVCHGGGLAGLVLYYDCTDDANGFGDLQDAIGLDSPAVDPTAQCPWIGNPDCPPRKPTCGSFPTATFPPCLGASTTIPPGTTKPPSTTKPPGTTKPPATTKPPGTTKPPSTTKPPGTTKPPAYLCSMAANWGAGECTNKPANDCVFVKPEGFNAGSGGSAASLEACGNACATRSGGCCYFKPKEGRCKWCPGAKGDNAGAGGRYQCIVP